MFKQRQQQQPEEFSRRTGEEFLEEFFPRNIFASCRCENALNGWNKLRKHQ